MTSRHLERTNGERFKIDSIRARSSTFGGSALLPLGQARGQRRVVDDLRTIFNGPKDITVGDRPDPAIQVPTDAVMPVVLACVCGSDLWFPAPAIPTRPSRGGSRSQT